MNDKSSLVVVGSGIKFFSHLTTESKSYIQQSDIVLYLVNDPAMKEWIRMNNANTESLDLLYTKYHLRIDSYRAITDYILQTLKKIQHVCVVFYGHPCIFSRPGLDAVIEARRQGYYAKVLPGISAEDCLMADLLIDTGVSGYQSFEATDFLLHRRQFDPASHLMLWQVDVIGVLDHAMQHKDNKGRKILANYLSQYYNDDHVVVCYEAAQYPSFEPLIQKMKLTNLPSGNFSPISTLYIPPSRQTHYDRIMAKELGISIEELEK